MLLEKFLNAISSLLPESLLLISDEKAAALERLNPQKIYVENVRSVFGVSHSIAANLCESAVRRGLFQSGIEVVCPDGSVAATAKSEQDLPQMVRCWTEENGFPEQIELATTSLEKHKFYRLNETPVIPDTHA